MRILGIYITDDLIRMGLLNDSDKQPAVKEYQSTVSNLKATLKKYNIGRITLFSIYRAIWLLCVFCTFLQ